MLPKKNRLSSIDFPVLLKSGKKVSNKDFFARYAFDKGAIKSYKVSFVTSAKLSKKAVVRNRIRRRLYTSLRRIAPFFLKGLNGVYMSITPKADCSLYNSDYIDNSLKNLFSLVKF